LEISGTVNGFSETVFYGIRRKNLLK
jgi:hypothetical protein